MKKILFVLVPIFFFFVLTTEIKAEEVNYSVRAIIPENQQDKSKSYFDLRMKPGEKQEITLALDNSSDKETVLEIKANSAITNQNGVIDYKGTKKKSDSTLPFNFSEIISGETKVTLQPKETRNVTYEITMPEKSFDGMALGGLYVKKLDNGPEDEEAQKNVQIKNVFSYVIPVAVKETNKKIEPELKLNEINPNLENYRTVVTANLQNSKPKLESNLSVKAEVTKKGSSTVLHKAEKNSMSMAPNSNFDFPISWDNQKLEAGKYTLKLDVSTSDGNWNFIKDFEIKLAESNKLNKAAVELEEDNSLAFIILGALGVMIIVLLIILILKKRKEQRVDTIND
ncbi:DUF916 and DUF3324 domain-containing protein [Carnobacterium gallinarum]|uniref:DUF916 and DUF3324 domain-containing protein n=1 Tax=Carnobacterium gallinarum TaxID=2749 RepID=UPI00068E2AF3|nr:DUF916 and DUF3324 domain-containing protein [Carnobacterium gallinarum]